jgi:hypothetical protein
MQDSPSSLPEPHSSQDLPLSENSAPQRVQNWDLDQCPGVGCEDGGRVPDSGRDHLDIMPHGGELLGKGTDGLNWPTTTVQGADEDDPYVANKLQSARFIMRVGRVEGHFSDGISKGQPRLVGCEIQVGHGCHGCVSSPGTLFPTRIL